ncbi:nose resistant to fluoxetine protein 6 [Caerostris extrusa]|uniref:Nose resistant to fluoxetine protein 6 n=1 Tax=Caerostris extrusa TaxID=172846 RepID=A0AAV4YGG3_CAEEX|nr:nose resistant to fluoxetine protein 6 [Caerostris extrusa]
MESSGQLNISSQCMRDAMKLIGGLKNVKPWAVRFIDASGKIMNGILVGSMSDFGAYDECVDTVATSDSRRDKGKEMFRGQYWWNGHKRRSKICPLFPLLSMRLGICVPSGCTLNDINQVAQMVGKSLSVNVEASRCEVKQENNYTPLIIIVMCIYSFAGLLLVIGSFIDIYSYFKGTTFKSTGVRVLLAFSIMSNFKKFSNTETSSETLSCLNGIRFLLHVMDCSGTHLFYC